MSEGSNEYKRRMEKAASKLPSASAATTKYYHCCLIDKRTKDRSRCPCTRFHQSEIWRHVRREMHLGPGYPKDGGLPWDVRRCKSHGCKFCREEPEVDGGKYHGMRRSQKVATMAIFDGSCRRLLSA